MTEHKFGKGRVFWGGDFRPEPGGAADLEDGLTGAKWIWNKEGNPAVAAPPGKRFFRKTLTIAQGSGIESAWLVMTADNSFQCWINGRRAGAGDNFERSYTMNVARC